MHEYVKFIYFKGRVWRTDWKQCSIQVHLFQKIITPNILPLQAISKSSKKKFLVFVTLVAEVVKIVWKDRHCEECQKPHLYLNVKR